MAKAGKSSGRGAERSPRRPVSAADTKIDRSRKAIKKSAGNRRNTVKNPTGRYWTNLT
jgi:hypothetical protein